MLEKEFRVDEIFDIMGTKGIFHAVNVNILGQQVPGSHPYIVRTSQNNGMKGYLVEDENKLNPGHTISFAQDTAQIFYQAEPYFTGNKIKVFQLKGHVLTEKLALYLITALNKAFSLFGWGQSYDSKILSEVKISLPVKTVMTPDWALLETSSKSYGGAEKGKIGTSSWKKFKVSELFVSQSGNIDIQKAHINGKGNFVVSSGLENNGIIGESDIESKVFPAGTLPATAMEVPDWNIMETYIRAIEKLIVKDVVDFKDAFIAKTKAIVGKGTTSSRCSSGGPI